MNTIKFVAHESFEFGGFCTWPRLSVHHGIARFVGGKFLWKNESLGFWDVRVGKAYKCPQMKSIKFLVHESFEFWGICTWPRLAVHHGIARWLVGSFVKKWNSFFLRCEGWKGLQISPNDYHEILGARKFWVRRVLHMAKVGGAPGHSSMAWWEVLRKNEIRDFWDVRVEKAYKYPQMNTMKFLVH